jgi:hypothetical protein
VRFLWPIDANVFSALSLIMRPLLAAAIATPYFEQIIQFFTEYPKHTEFITLLYKLLFRDKLAVEPLFSILSRLAPPPAEFFAEVIPSPTDEFRLIECYFLLENRNPPSPVTKQNPQLLLTLLEIDEERTVRLIRLFFESTTPETLPARVNFLLACSIAERHYHEVLKLFMDWPMMFQGDWFMLFVGVPLQAFHEMNAFELAITMLRRALATASTLRVGRIMIYFLFLYKELIWNVADHIMRGNPRGQTLGLKYFRYLMYAFPQAMDWTFDFLESKLPTLVNSLTATRRELSKLVTELVREVLADPFRSDDLRRVMNIYQAAFVFALRFSSFEFRAIEKFITLATAILNAPGLDHGMADMREVFCLLNRISDWREVDSGVLSRFFTAVLRHSLWHFNGAEVRRFAFESEAQPCEQRIAVLHAIATVAPGPFSRATAVL